MINNKVLLIGYTGMDPVCTNAKNGNKRAMIRIATHHPGILKEGKKTFNTMWHNVIAWNKTAQYAERNFVKGSRILVEGSIVYTTYLDQAGHTCYATYITAHSLTNLDR